MLQWTMNGGERTVNVQWRDKWVMSYEIGEYQTNGHRRWSDRRTGGRGNGREMKRNEHTSV